MDHARAGTSAGARWEESRGRRWIGAWLAVAVVLALLLLANAARDYVFVRRILASQQVRHQMAQYAASLEQALRHTGVPALAPTELLREPAELPPGTAWVEVRRPDGSVLARRGAAAGSAFTHEEETEHFRSHEPLFRVVDSRAGELVVQAFPLYGRPPELAAAAAAPEPAARAGPRSFLVLEIAVPLVIRDASVLWPIRRNLLVNSSAALALLATVVIAALGFRSYERGRRLEAQLEIAREVQAELLPARTEGLDPVQLATLYRPAEQVGGDFYDAFRTGDGRVALVIGDVSGKGVPAALLMGVIHGAVRSVPWWESAARHEQETAQLNRLLCRDASASRYASMFWCSYQTSVRQLCYLNAGHCPPLLVAAGAAGVTVTALDTGGPVLGLMEEAGYVQARRDVSAGEVLVLFSDGLVEATNAAGEEYGVGRLRGLLEGTGSADPAAVRDAIVASVTAFGGGAPLADDVTLVVARFG
ncbi:MAG TPA: PP2C family protein-serine/threonine phosphatase [Vicinamibacteria bacterium]|nr:PP2C family protein-serine/threonine phosphatase [Vicinamibacteria bacterium]